VIVFPAVTGFGIPLLVTARSQATFTSVVTVVLLLPLLGSAVVAETEEVVVIVPIATVEGTFNTTTISAEVDAARLEPSVQLIVPVAPTAGVVQVHPAGASTDWNVVFAGVASVKAAPAAAAGPLFVTVCV
jgi:sirohydrochlorin ferrochelatase